MNDEKVLDGQAQEIDNSSWDKPNDRGLDPENPIRENNSPETSRGSISNDGSVTQSSKNIQLPQGGKMPNCRHIFHKQCLDDWLKIKLTCPICRSGLKPMSPSRSILAPTSLPSRLQGQQTASVASRGEMTAVESLCDACNAYAPLLFGGALFLMLLFASGYLVNLVLRLAHFHEK